MNTNDPVPLCVDLDGTLLLSDSLVESFCLLLRKSPWMTVCCPIWLFGGRANLKRQIARRVSPDVGSWPLNAEVLEYVQTAKSQGRKIVLATAADSQIAAAVQTRLGLFDDVLASDGARNLSSQTKASALEQQFGAGNFEYIGNSTSDLPVWQAACAACVVGGNGLVARVKNCTTVNRVFVQPRISFKDWLRALRVHQWSKNLLLLIPIMSAHQWMQVVPMARVLLGVAAFSLCASSVYLINDLLDLESDRHHHSKQHRPFASGRLPLLAGLVLAPALLALSMFIAGLIGWKFAAIMGGYYVATLLYSLRLKQIELLDVLTLAGLYGIRILAGRVAAAVAISDWLMMFSFFLFLSLAFAKRFTEIRLVRTTPDNRLKGRGYVGGDAELVSSMGVGSGFLSVLVLAMYTSSPAVTSLYSRPQVLVLACPLLLYWVCRVWLRAHRGTMHDDPILFALRDQQSWIVVVCLLALGVAAGPK